MGIETGGKHFRCDSCGKTFAIEDGDAEAAIEEAQANNLEPKHCDVVCDDCYAKTPWGMNQIIGEEGISLKC